MTSRKIGKGYPFLSAFCLLGREAPGEPFLQGSGINHLVDIVVKVSASRAEDRGFEARLSGQTRP